MLRSKLIQVLIPGLMVGLTVGCTQPVEVDADSKLVSASKSLPLSYDTSIDQVAHMSCSNMPTSSNFNKSAYFTYRVGAYTDGGIQLKDSFFETLKNRKAEYQSSVLVGSAANKDTVLQVALRSRANYQALYTKSGTATLDQDYANIFTELGTEDVSDSLIALPIGSRMKFIRTGTVGGARLEGSLYFGDTATMVQSSRDFLQGKGSTAGSTGLLGLTYTNGSATSARSILDFNPGLTTTNNQRSVYGRGYIMTFGKPTPKAGSSINAGYPENVVSIVQEQSLDSTTPLPSASWTCPVSMQFRIVRSTDINKTGAKCRKMADPELMTPELRVVRNSLRSEDWFVDMDNGCIIPKKSGADCYGAVTDVKYVLAEPCGTDPTTGFSNCTQFASVCYRTN